VDDRSAPVISTGRRNTLSEREKIDYRPISQRFRGGTATTTIPIVFQTGGDPVRLGLVASLNRPGGNVTGVTQLNEEVATKRLEVLHELVPTASVIALLVNPAVPALASIQSSNFLSAARALGLELPILNASTERDFDVAFAKLNQLRAGAFAASAAGVGVAAITVT
jgi:putative ABC transport system substrate-binding protein